MSQGWKFGAYRLVFENGIKEAFCIPDDEIILGGFVMAEERTRSKSITSSPSIRDHQRTAAIVTFLRNQMMCFTFVLFQ